MLYLSASTRYYFYGKIVDMPKGCYGLCGLVTNDMKKNILSGDVFVFMNTSASPPTVSSLFLSVGFRSQK